MASSREAQRLYRARHRARINAANQRWKDRNRERVREDAKRYYERTKARRKERLAQISRKTRLKSSYGLTTADVQRHLAVQNGRCPLCAVELLPGRGGNIAIDHNHETGVFRALLCRPCNSGLGLLGDDPERLRRAAEYVEHHRRQQSA